MTARAAMGEPACGNRWRAAGVVTRDPSPISSALAVWRSPRRGPKTCSSPATTTWH